MIALGRRKLDGDREVRWWYIVVEFPKRGTIERRDQACRWTLAVLPEMDKG